MKITNIGKAEIPIKGSWKKHEVVNIEFFADDGTIHTIKFVLKELLSALKTKKGKEITVGAVYPHIFQHKGKTIIFLKP